MSTFTASRSKLFIPYQNSVQYIQYYVATFNLGSASSNGAGAYGYHSYGSTVATSTNTPAYGTSTADVTVVVIDNILYSKVASLAICLTTNQSFFYDSATQRLYINFSTSTSSSKVFYPDIRNNPAWSSSDVYVKASGTWSKAKVWIKVAGTWTAA